MKREMKRTDMRLHRLIRSLPGLALALFLPAAAGAQNAGNDRDTKIDVIGTVTDGASGEAIAGVYVEIEALARSAFSDQDGRFVIRRVPRGTWTVRAAQLGYAEWSAEFAVGDEPAQLAVSLQADPVLLEEIRVVSDRIERRRKATPVSVIAYDADQLNTSAAFDAGYFVRSRLPVVGCPSFFAATDCVLRRGRPTVPRVYIDEVRLPGGFDFLGMYNPNELYLVEIYDSGSQIRVYTKAFAERLALGRERVFPIFVY
ncbi:MAG: carboxypeptidase regulatory-like domain-containing protein [Longimicrobiales bacterium]